MLFHIKLIIISRVSHASLLLKWGHKIDGTRLEVSCQGLCLLHLHRGG